MKIINTFFLLLLSGYFLSVGVSDVDAKLLHQDDFEYIGSFKFPHGDLGGGTGDYKTFSYSKGIITFNPDNNSLFAVGHPYTEEVIELSIPDLKNGVDVGELNVSSVLQTMTDITEGNRDYIWEDQTNDSASVNGTHIGGLLKWDDKLIGTVYAYYSPEINYDTGDVITRTHFVSSLDLSVEGDFVGMSKVGDISTGYYPRAGQIAGYMTKIPDVWQTRLGGPALTGMSGISVATRTSFGSAAFSFDPDEIVDTTSVTPATMLLGYPNEHSTIGGYYDTGTLYHMGTQHIGVSFPTGTDTILYTGRQGLGESCYGPGSPYPEEHGNRYDSAPPNNTCNHEVMASTTTDPCCYDPESSSKGAHSYPYVAYVWAYDAHDLERVRNGGRIVDNPSPNLVDSVSSSSTELYKPWHIKPYDTWVVPHPYEASRTRNVGAAAYDEANKLLYLTQPFADGTYPIVNVFHLNLDDDEIRADVDQNSTINSTDAMLVLRNSLGLDMSGASWVTSATTGDVDCNDVSNSTDAMLLLRYSLGLSMDGTGWCVN